jgi:phosphocarrier protein HPr
VAGDAQSPDVVSAERKIRNRAGLQLAARFKSEVRVEKEGTQVNGKSIMGLLTLVAALGVSITIEAEGPDATDAVNALAALVENGFGEGVVDD